MKKVISICIIKNNADKILPKECGIHSIFTYRDAQTNTSLSDKSELHFFELNKIDLNKPVADMTELERVGAYMLCATNSKKHDLIQEILSYRDEVIILTQEILRRLTEDEILREKMLDKKRDAVYFEAMRIREQMELEAEKERIHQDGFEKGAHQTTLTNARRMKENGIELGLIQTITGLTESEILDL